MSSMFTNPYEILGISPNATEEEIKKAYHQLSKKYHPDSYANNPLSELAEEKFKEIQEAYKQIQEQRQNGKTNTNYTNYNDTHNSNNEDEIALNQVTTYLNTRQYKIALSMLDKINGRPARWFYYASIANTGLGNNLVALEQAKRAVSMDPANQEYTNYLNQIQFQSQRYQTNSYNNNRGNYSMTDCCCDLWCADTCCECMGGDLISCC